MCYSHMKAIEYNVLKDIDKLLKSFKFMVSANRLNHICQYPTKIY